MGPYYTLETHQTSSKDATYELAKKLGKFIMLFSVLTFFLSNPSWVSLFLDSFFTHLSSFPSQIVAHINNKNYVFLLCNGILVILAKSSRKTKEEDSVTSSANINEAHPILELDEEREINIPLLQNHGVMIETELEVKENECCENKIMEEESGNGEENKSDEFCVEVEDDLAEEESIAKMSTEELNTKFDEFIRKMKEEIRLEAQQQLIMV